MADIELPNMQNLVGAQSHPRARSDTEALGRASGSANNNDDGHEDDQSNFAIL